MSDSNKAIIKNTGWVAFLSFLSRVTGLIRDVVSAHFFGLSRIWDAFVFAFTFPNILRRLVSEGVLTSAFVPIFTDLLETEGRNEAERFARQVGSLFLFVGLLFLLVFYCVVELLIGTISFQEDALWFLIFLKVLAPYVVVLFLISVSMGILFSEKQFLIPAFTPIILNVCWVSVIVFVCSFLSKTSEQTLRLLCASIVLSGLIQMLCVWIPVKRKGYVLFPLLNWGGENLKRFTSLLFPAVIGMSVLQLNLFMDLIFGFFSQEGVSSSLWYSVRLMQFPLSIFATALSTVLLPEFSSLSAAQASQKVKEILRISLKGIFFIVFPSMVGMMVLSEPIIQILFQRGAFTYEATLRTQAMFLGYMGGVLFYSAVPVLVSAFYSVQDMKTPMKIGLFCFFLNGVLNFLCLKLGGPLGLAVSTGVIGLFHFLFLLIILRGRLGDFGVKEIVFDLTRVAFLSVLMGGVVVLLNRIVAFSFFQAAFLNQLFNLLLIILSGVIVYLVLSFLFRVEESRRLFLWILKKK